VKISSFQVVTAFDADRSILLSLGPALKSIEQRTGARLFQVNAPEDAPPSLPRLIIRLKDGTSLNVCQDRLDLTLPPPEHVSNNLSESATYLRRIFSMMIEPLLDQIPSYDWLGIVINLEYKEDPLKSASSAEAIYPVFKIITNLNVDKDAFRSFRMQFGYEENGLFYTIAIDGFEEREFRGPVNAKGGIVKMDASEFPMKSCGVSISHDVNNRPGSKTEVKEDFEKILNNQMRSIEELPDRLQLTSVLA